MRFVILLFALFCVSNSFADDDEKDPDPWIGLNKVTHKFNDTADRLVLKPVAKGYQKMIPRPLRIGVGNFFSNIGDVGNATNNFLQGKVGDGLTDLLRITINTTIGLGGLFDAASNIGLEKHEEDFGQTFAVWGLPRGPYLVIPFLGPSTVTDALGRPFNTAADPLRYLYPVDDRNVLYGIRTIDDREGLLAAEKAVFGDKYLFYRDAYLQRREYLINDGEVEDPFADDF